MVFVAKGRSCIRISFPAVVQSQNFQGTVGVQSVSDTRMRTPPPPPSEEGGLSWKQKTTANCNGRSRRRPLLRDQDMGKKNNNRNGIEKWFAVAGWRLAVGGWRLVVSSP